MTVIAYDGKNLAADKQITLNGQVPVACTKIRKFKNGDVAAICGSGDTAFALLDWYGNGADPKTMPKNEDKDGEDEADLIVAKKGQVGLYIYNRYPVPMYIESRQQAYGSGAPFALAAMKQGKTARQAVEFASQICVFCGLGVDNVVVTPPAKKPKKPKAKKAKKK